MFGFNEKEMQEAEKLADLYDRLRRYAREAKVKVIVATAGVQSAVDVTDMTVSWHPSEPRVVDYLNIVRTKERPVSEKMHELSWDFTMPIGYSALRDGVRQVMDGENDPVRPSLTAKDIAALLEKHPDMDKWTLNGDFVYPVGGSGEPSHRIPVVGAKHDHISDRDVEFMYQGRARLIGVSTPSARSDILDDSVRHTYPHGRAEAQLGLSREDLESLMQEYPVGKLDLPEILAKAAEKFGIDPGVLEAVMRVESAEAYRDPIIVGGRQPGRDTRLLGLALDRLDKVETVHGWAADFDGQVAGPKRFISKRHHWGEGADTPESGARKRRQSDVHVNGKPKKGWQK